MELLAFLDFDAKGNATGAASSSSSTGDDDEEEEGEEKKDDAASSSGSISSNSGSSSDSHSKPDVNHLTTDDGPSSISTFTSSTSEPHDISSGSSNGSSNGDSLVHDNSNDKYKSKNEKGEEEVNSGGEMVSEEGTSPTWDIPFERHK